MDNTPAVADGPPTTQRRTLWVLLAALACAVLAVDQATKVWVVAVLTDHPPVPVIDGLIQLNLARNAGAAFSMATGSTVIFSVIAVTVSVIIVRIARRLGSIWWAVALGLLLGGALGNLTDRLLRAPGFARGHVVDFIQFPHFPIFNVADSCIVVSAVLIGLLGLRGIGVDGTRTVA